MTAARNLMQLAERYLTPYIMIIALAAVVVSTWLDIDARIAAGNERRITACQAAYNNAFAVNIRLRGHLSDAERDASGLLQNATAGLINTVFTLPRSATQAQREAALIKAYGSFRLVYADYQAAEARIAAERRRNPLPPLPAQACS